MAQYDPTNIPGKVNLDPSWLSLSEMTTLMRSGSQEYTLQEILDKAQKEEKYDEQQYLGNIGQSSLSLISFKDLPGTYYATHWFSKAHYTELGLNEAMGAVHRIEIDMGRSQVIEELAKESSPQLRAVLDREGRGLFADQSLTSNLASALWKIENAEERNREAMEQGDRPYHTLAELARIQVDIASDALREHRLEETLIDTLKNGRLRPTAATVELVSEILRGYDLGKDEVKSSMVDLADRQILNLQRHNWPNNPAFGDVSLMPKDGLGNIYIGVAVRDGAADLMSRSVEAASKEMVSGLWQVVKNLEAFEAKRGKLAAAGKEIPGWEEPVETATGIARTALGKAEMVKVLVDINRGTTATDPEQVQAETVGRARETVARMEAAGLSDPKDRPASYMLQGLRQIAGLNPDEHQELANKASEIANEAFWDIDAYEHNKMYAEARQEAQEKYNQELANALREIQTSETTIDARDRAQEILYQIYQREKAQQEYEGWGGDDITVDLRSLTSDQGAKVMLDALEKVSLIGTLSEAKGIAGQALAETGFVQTPTEQGRVVNEINRHATERQLAQQQQEMKIEPEITARKEGGRYVLERPDSRGEYLLHAMITPERGGFNLHVSELGYDNEYDWELGDVVPEAHDLDLHKSREETVNDLQQALEPFGFKVPEDMRKELAAYEQREYTYDYVPKEFGDGWHETGYFYTRDGGKFGRSATIAPEAGGFNIAVNGPESKLYDGSAPTVEEAQKALEPYGIAIPESLSQALVERQAEQQRLTAEHRAEWVEKFGSDPDVPRFQFVEDALAAGAEVKHLSIDVQGSGWTVVGFENAPGAYLLKGEDVYVTQVSAVQAEASIKEDPIKLPGLGDLSRAGDIEIEVPNIPFSKVIDSMEPGNRAILESALNQGAVVNRFWIGQNGNGPADGQIAIISFEKNPYTYIFNNGDGRVESTMLDFGGTRYAVAFDYEITDRAPVQEIKIEENQVEPRKVDYSVGM